MSVDVRAAEEPPHRVHHRHHGGFHQPTLTETADAELNVGTWDPDHDQPTLAPIRSP
jgi:hypothetical protein